MRVNELRTELDKYDKSTLKEIAVALYKLIPKNRKEDEGLDELLQNYTKEKTKTVINKVQIDFNALKAEIEKFIYFANNDYYYAPNKYIRKEQRSKWRFEVKRFIKDLSAVSGEDSEEAALLLANIYTMLCYACHYYIFSTENPFSAVGYQQTDLLRLVLGKIFYGGFDMPSIKTAVFLTLDSNVDRVTLHDYLIFTLIDILKTPDTKEMALLQCVSYAKEYDSYQASKNLFKYSTRDDYRRKEHRNYAAELYLLLKFSLHEYDEGIAYFWKNYLEYDKEITLYCLLCFLDEDEFKDLWIREYEKAVAKGIKPRDSLKEEYLERKAEAQ